MDKDTDNILEAINDKIFAKILCGKLTGICYNRDLDLSKYKDFTVLDFLQLYKINRLLELGLINKKQYEYLVELFYIKMELNNVLGRELLRELRSMDSCAEYVSEMKEILIENIRRIDIVFERYGLRIDNISIKKIVEPNTDIENNNYKIQDSSLAELEAFTYSMRNLRLHVRGDK